ncbi:S100P-binding protein isoform 1-T3 [Mantella aurantiaca]
MKVTNESSDFSPDAANSERHVMLYPAAWEDLSPETMEDIKISIVNDRATGLKRQREESTAVSPCSKKLCSVVFNCSTPNSTSFPSWSSSSTSRAKGVKWSPVSTSSHTPEQNSEFSDEWDDSLLEPSDNEDDSPLYLTIDEIESLLEDDASFAAGPSGFDICNATCIVTSKSEDEEEKLCTEPSPLDVSNTLTEATLWEEDLNNDATIAVSPSHSITHPVEHHVSKQKNSIVGTVQSDSVQEINGMSTAVPVLDKTEAFTQLASDCSANLPLPSPQWEWNDDPDLSFDGDIDNLLAISPGGTTSSEEEPAAEPSIQCTEQIRSAVSDSASTFELPDSVPVNENTNSAGSDTADVVQQLFPSTLSESDALEVHCPPSTVPELPRDSEPTSTSAVIISETQVNTDAAEDVNPSTSTENDAPSTAGLSEQSVNSGAAQTSSSQQTITAPLTNPPAAPQERSCVAVTPLPRPAHRSFNFCSFDLESDKNNYCDQVLMHIEGPEGANNLDPFHELASFLNKISRENQNWQHPSNFSRRNHPRCGKKPSACYTLNEWVEKNGGAVQRFTNIPSPFQRSPLPEALPFQFS